MSSLPASTPFSDPFAVPSLKLASELRVRPPASKSMTCRGLIMGALSSTPVAIKNPLESEDTLLTADALSKLGCSIEKSSDLWLVNGKNFGVNIDKSSEIHLGNAGTTMRLLTAVLCAKSIACRITGSERMLQRPMADLIQALVDLGGEIISENENGYPPVKTGYLGLEGGVATIPGTISSQFVSGLLIATPLARNNSIIRVEGEWVSRPYIAMTQAMLKRFRVDSRVGESAIFVGGRQNYISPGTLEIEPDASSASYPLILGALHGVPVHIEGLGKNSLQGDTTLCHYLEQMGYTVEMSDLSITLTPTAKRVPLPKVNLSAIPDAAMTLCTLLAVTPGESHLFGLANLRVKECDRLKALETELTKMGAHITAYEDGFDIQGIAIEKLKPTQITTYNDHRIAMCLALLGTLCPGTTIENPACVQKSYPEFWDDLLGWLGF